MGWPAQFEHRRLLPVGYLKDKPFKNCTHTPQELRDLIFEEVKAISVIDLFKTIENVFNSVVMLTTGILRTLFFEPEESKMVFTDPILTKYFTKYLSLFIIAPQNGLIRSCRPQNQTNFICLLY